MITIAIESVVCYIHSICCPQMRKSFSRAVLVIRDPYLAIQAEFNRQSGGHIGHAQPDKYMRDGGRCE